MAGNTHVPDKLEGYMLQVRHALFELISVDDRIVSVEAYDDVAIESMSAISLEIILPGGLLFPCNKNWICKKETNTVYLHQFFFKLRKRKNCKIGSHY